MNDVAVYIENLPKKNDAIALWNKRAVFLTVTSYIVLEMLR